MTRYLPLVATVTLGSFAVASCRDHSPTQPDSALESVPTPLSRALAPNSWVAKADLPSGRHGLALGVARNSSGRDIVYAIGGYDIGASSSNVATTVTAYDFATNTWTSRAPLPAGLAHPNGVGNIGGKLYVSGGVREVGNDNVENLPYLFVYDPARNSWSRRADLPQASSDGVTGVIGGKLYVATGGKLYRYNPATNRWATLAPPARARFAGAGGVINGKLYVVGGFSTDGPWNEVEVYDPVTNKWSARARMPTARVWMDATVLKNKLYVIGGRGAEALATVEVFNPATNTWTTKRPMPTAREQLDVATFATPSGNFRILAVGGWEYLRTNEMYAP